MRKGVTDYIIWFIVMLMIGLMVLLAGYSIYQRFKGG